MMYSEFAEAVGCRDNAHNHKVFENLEVMYMNTDMSKEEIYEYGRKLVDNSKSKEQLEAEAKIKAEIDECKSYIAYYKADLERTNQLIAIEEDKMWLKIYEADRKRYKAEIKSYKSRINELKWLLD